MNNKPITRFAPSPTGNLHIGSARTALFNYLFTKQLGGQIYLRIDDTDKERSKLEYEANILEGLAWLGLSFDQTYRQSERGEIYRNHLEKLIESGKAYISTNEAEGKGEVIRFRNPNRIVSFKDEIRGLIKFDTSDLGDFVLAKDLDTPLYHLASVIDDYEMNITHIIRGEDHISNTPRQILITEAIGADIPTYAHIPLILAPDKSKMSKRHGATSISEYRDQGYLANAIVNFLALLGWSPQAGESKTDEEVFDLDQLIERFSIKAIQRGGAIFNQDKLNWLNREHIKKINTEKLIDIIESYLPSHITGLPGYNRDTLIKITPIITERITTFSDITKTAEAGEYDFFFKKPLITKEMLKNTEFLSQTKDIISKIEPDKFTVDNIKSSIWDFATEKGRGEVLWPLRVALTGREKSPDPFTVASIIGQKETIARINNAISL